MTGPVNWETVQWLAGIIVAIAGAMAAMATMIWRWQRWLEMELSKRDEARRQELAVRDAKIEDLRRSLDAHKLYAAEHYATEEGLKDALEPILRAIERLGDRLDGLIPRLSDHGQDQRR